MTIEASDNQDGGSKACHRLPPATSDMDCYEPPIHGNEPPIHGTEPPSIDLSRHYSPHQVMKAPIRRFTRNFLIQVSSAPRDAVLQHNTPLALPTSSVKHSNRQKQHTNNLVPPNQSTPTSRESITPAKTCPASQHLLVSVYVAIKTAPAPGTMLAPASKAPYLNARAQRLAACKPYQSSRAGSVKQGRSTFPQGNVASSHFHAFCGFEMRASSKWTPNQLGVREQVPVDLTGQESLNDLLNDLQRLFEGKVELKLPKVQERPLFESKHFPFCLLGTRKGGYVRDGDALLDHLTESKTIDLILDYDAFNEDDLDKQEEAIIARKEARSLTTTTIIGHGSSTDSGPAATPLVLSTTPSTTSQCNPHVPIQPAPIVSNLNCHTTSYAISQGSHLPPDLPPGNSRLQHISPSTDLERRYIPDYSNYPISHPAPRGIGHIRPGPMVPPWLARPILDYDDLSWERFGTQEISGWYRGLSESSWTDGIRYDLDRNGVGMTQRLCRYKIDYSNGCLNSHQGKTLPAKLYEGGRIYDMVAEFSLIERDLWTDSYTTEPNYAMRTYAMARQFMFLFTNIMGASDAGPELKFWASYLRVSRGCIPVHHDVSERPRTDVRQEWDAQRDMIPLPTPPTNRDVNRYEYGREFPDDAPERVFFMQERIHDFLPLLDPAAEDYFMSDGSPPPEKLLHAFQHYLYKQTNGQMTMTGFWGNPPLISRPRILDLNKKATWSRDGTDVKALHLDFIAKHICTDACRAAHLSTLVEIPWPPAKPKDESVVEAKPTTELNNNMEEKPAGLKNTRMESEDIELIEIVRQGHQVLAQRHA
ncbi:hypothetical protein PSHT_07364 [Puccinia striiformis]|uniref:Alpha-type protein kinase domain-containing protein n=1 Tax=Puccinia striiformis TaxID=27350 RepID=A0A2S4VYI5_9BASI|nr:hypothetical protein PSHT_07364 [Puccinia striiformis]